MRPGLYSAFAAACLGAVAGCSDFERIDFQYSPGLPLDIQLSYEEIRLPAGIAVTTIARPMASDGLMSRDTVVELTTGDPGVLGVAFALPNELGVSSENADWTFVIYAVKAGTTTVPVRIDGTEEGSIPVIVLPQ